MLESEDGPRAERVYLQVVPSEAYYRSYAQYREPRFSPFKNIYWPKFFFLLPFNSLTWPAISRYNFCLTII